MFTANRFCLLALVATVVGCATIRNAHDAQREVAAKGDESVLPPSPGKLDLKSYSLAQLVDFALTNRPSIVSARLAVVDARLALKELAADAPVISDTPWTVPHVSVNGGYSESSQGVKVGDGTGFRTSGNASFGISLELLVYDFGRYDARAKAQAERVIAAEQSLVDQNYLVYGDVAKAFFNFVEARSQLVVAHTNRQGYADQLARAEARLAAGEAHQLDVLRAKVDLANADQTLVVASNTVDTTGAAMMYALGIDASRGTYREVLDISPIDFASVYRAFDHTDYSLETAYELARTNSPEMRVVRARLRSASHDVDYAIANMMPSVSASTTFSWSDPFWYWNWGVSAFQSLFEGFRKTTAVDRAVVAMRSAAADVDACEQNLSLNLETAISVRDNAYEAIRTSIAALRSSEENLRMVTEQYMVGDVSRIDESDAVAQYSRAIGDCLTAYYYGQRAEAALFAIIGMSPVYDRDRFVNVKELK